MNIKAAWKYSILTVGMAITAVVILSSPWSKAACSASEGQAVVRWKEESWPCRHWWSLRCRRSHRTYKVTLNEGTPLLDKNGRPLPIAGGKIRKWMVYDSVVWNRIGEKPRQRDRYPDYEPIAENEYVVIVETRYWLFHKVEDNLRLCTQKP
jgi:hypothetical protein